MAVHVMTVLAYKDGDRVTSTLLAQSVNTNPVVVRRLLLALQRARLVETRQGAGFGSRLSRSPARIHLAHIFEAVEDEETFVLPPRKPNQECPVGQCISAQLHKVFVSARDALRKELARTTLADVVAEVKACCSNEGTKKARN